MLSGHTAGFDDGFYIRCWLGRAQACLEATPVNHKRVQIDFRWPELLAEVIHNFRHPLHNLATHRAAKNKRQSLVLEDAHTASYGVVRSVAVRTGAVHVMHMSRTIQ